VESEFEKMYFELQVAREQFIKEPIEGLTPLHHIGNVYWAFEDKVDKKYQVRLVEDEHNFQKIHFHPLMGDQHNPGPYEQMFRWITDQDNYTIEESV